MMRYRRLVVACAIIGCAKPRPEAPPPSPASVTPRAPAPSAPADDGLVAPDDSCGEAEACAAEGAKLLASRERGAFESACPKLVRGCVNGSAWACENLGLAGHACPGAKERPGTFWFDRGCTQGGSSACLWLATSSELEKDPAARRRAFARGCDAPNPTIATCTSLAKMALEGEGGPRDEAMARSAARKACAAKSGTGCGILGDLTIGNDRAAAIEAYGRACQRADERSCERIYRLLGKDAAWTAMGRLKTDAVTVDGTKLESVYCETTEYAGAPSELLRAIAARRDALDACTKTIAGTPLQITAENGELTRVYAAGTRHDVNQCVERALLHAPSKESGRCSVIVEHGKPAKKR